MLPKGSLVKYFFTLFFKRVGTYISFLAVILLTTFFLNRPDPSITAHKTCSKCYLNSSAQDPEFVQGKDCFIKVMGLDKPAFYFEWTHLATPATFSAIYPKEKKQAMGWLLQKYGNWEYIDAYYHNLDHLIQMYPDEAVKGLYFNPQRASNYFNILQKKIDLPADIRNQIMRVSLTYHQILQHPLRWKVYIPKLIFHGTGNQFHQWFTSLWKTGTHTRLYDQINCLACSCNPVPTTVPYQSSGLGKAFIITFLLAIVSTIIIFIISIPLGVLIAYFQQHLAGKMANTLLIILDAIPTFIIAFSLYLLFNIRDYQERIIFQQEMLIGQNQVLMTIVILIYTLSFVAPLTQIIVQNLLDEMNKDYFRTAISSGHSRISAIILHVIPNILFPVITLGVGIMTGLIGGSVVVENIFDIPGLGRFAFEAAQNNHIQPLMMVVAVTGTWGLLGSWAINYLYKRSDPRIS